MSPRAARLIVIGLSLALVTTACGGDGTTTTQGGGGVSTTPGGTGRSAADLEAEGLLAAPGSLTGRIGGAGATFPTPVFQDWLFEYSDPRVGNPRQPGVNIDYQSIGSGGGIQQFLELTVDWGTSERYLRDEQLAQAESTRGCPALQVPMMYGSVVLAFGDPGFDEMVLSAEAIAGIFQRDIIKWNDPALVALNPDMDLPDRDIIPVHRSDGSGTTSVFTTYLEDAAPNWLLGSGTEVNWPAGTVGGQGNEGVTAQTQANPQAIGYVNQSYALINQLPQARVINEDGNPIYPTLQATTVAVDGLEVPDNFQFDILGIGGDGYPITGTVWNFYYECGYTPEAKATLLDFWTWATQSTEADTIARELGYAPLGEAVKEMVLTALMRIGIQD